MTIYVSVTFTSMNGGWKSIAVGLGSWRSIRQHHTPRHWNGVDSLMDPHASPMHRMINEMGSVIRARYNVFQIECVLDNQVWPSALRKLLQPLGQRKKGAPGPPRSLLAAAALAPIGLQRFVRGLVRSGYGLRQVNAGAVEEVHARSLETLFKEQGVRVPGPVDILILGIPNLSPYSAFSVFNPILLRSLALGYLYGAYRQQPFVREGGVLIACNPGRARFHAGHHPSYIHFWENDLDNHLDPDVCWSELADVYANNESFLRAYRQGHAYHGSHSLMNWMWAGTALRRLEAVILAGARENDTAQKIGFVPARDLSSAMAMAQERVGPHATSAYQVMPPLFTVNVG